MLQDACGRGETFAFSLRTLVPKYMFSSCLETYIWQADGFLDHPRRAAGVPDGRVIGTLGFFAFKKLALDHLECLLTEVLDRDVFEKRSRRLLVQIVSEALLATIVSQSGTSLTNSGIRDCKLELTCL